MSFITIYITHANAENAQQLVDQLLADKLIACGNIFPIKSSYWWQGKITHESEWVSLVKTRSELWSYLQNKISSLHPYDTPCIMKSVVEANAEYEAWIKASVNLPTVL